MSNRALRRFLESVTGEARIEDMPEAARDRRGGHRHAAEVVFRSGLIWLAMLASISIPGAFPAVKMTATSSSTAASLNPVPTR